MPSRNLGNTQNHIPVRYGLYHLLTKPLAELHHTFLTCPPMLSQICCTFSFCAGAGWSYAIQFKIRQGRRVAGRGRNGDVYMKRRAQKIFVTAISASDPGKPVFQNPTIQIPIYHLFDIGTKKAVSLLKPFFINPFKGFEVVFHAPIIRRVLRFTLPIDGCCHGDRYLCQGTKTILQQIPCRHYILGSRGRLATICDEYITIFVKKRPKYVTGWLS